MATTGVRSEQMLEGQRVRQEISRLRSKGEIELADLLERADAGCRLIREGMDPALALSFVVWPTPKIEADLRDRRIA